MDIKEIKSWCCLIMQFGMKRVFRINLTQSFTTDICVYITGL